MAPSWFDRPSLLPHKADFSSGHLLFLPTNRSNIEAAAFLDGRTKFATGSPIRISFDEILKTPMPIPQVERYIIHIGFCGSTFLSRLISSPGHALVLREPNILANLANVRAAIDSGDISDHRLRAILDAVRTLLNRSWAEDEPIVVKPSNWFNNFLPDWHREDAKLRFLLLTMTRHDFAFAVMRGGSQRLAFVARAAVHLSSRCDDDAALVSGALAEGTDAQKLMRLVLILHHIQAKLFGHLVNAGSKGGMHILTFEQLRADPIQAALKTATILELEIPLEAIERNYRHWGAVNAKEPSMSFSSDEEIRGMKGIETYNGTVLRDALAWAERAIDP